MASLLIVCVLIYVTLSEGRDAHIREAYYVKHTPVETGVSLKTLECGVNYLDQEFGVLNMSEDETECTTEPWAWFDTQDTETGYTHYRKDKIRLTYDPPLYFYTNGLESINRADFMWSFPAPMFTDSKVDVYFTPKIPFDRFSIELHDRSSSDIICQFKVFSLNDEMTLSYKINGHFEQGDQLYQIPFVTETEYKVTIKATLTSLQLLIDDEFKLQIDHAKRVTKFET